MAAWSSTTHYAIRDTASSGGLLYIALVPNINVVPGSDRTTWILFASPPSPVVEVAMVGDGAVYEVAVPGSPVQFEGTFAPALVPQAANTVLAGPTSGGAATPTFRALVAGDVPGGGGGSALTDSHILVGNASNVATDVAMSGDAAISNTGAVTVSKSGGVAFGSAAFVGTGTFDASGAAAAAQAAAIAASCPSALANGKIYVGNGIGAATAVTMSGDGTLSNTGALSVTKSGGVAFGSAAFVATTAFDAAGAAATAQTNAEAFAANASNISSGTIGAGFLPLGSSTAFGAVKVDGTTITATAGVLSAVSSGSGGGAASIQDDGTNLYVAMSDADGQLIVDGSGDPIFVKEVLPPNSLPLASASAFGAVKVDGASIAAIAGVLSTAALCFQVQLVVDLSVTSGTPTLCKPTNFITNTLGTQYASGTGKFTPTKAGKYIVFCTSQGKATSPDSITQASGAVFKNGGSGVGTQICVGQCGPAPAGPIFSFVSLAFGVVDMNGTTDTLELSVRCDSSGAGALVCLGAGNVTFGAIYIGA